MEDILASIRRIIADDQSQANRPAAAPARRPAAAPERANGAAARTERGAEYGEVLDLARMPNAALSEHPPQARPEPAPATRPSADGRGSGGGAQDQGYVSEDRNPSPAHRSAPAGPAPSPAGPAQSYVNGYAAPTLVRDYEQGGYGPVEAAPAPSDRHVSATEHDMAHEARDMSGEDEGLLSPALGTSVMSAFETLAATVVLQNSDMLDRVMRELMRPLIKTWLDENLPTLVERLVRTEIERVARGGRG